MASQEEIAALRLLINEPDDSNGWTDERLSIIIDGTTSMQEAASKVWTSKAGTFSTLVDVAESGSSRKLSDLHKNALAMAKYFDQQHEEALPVPADYTVVNRIRRGFA